MRTLELLAPAKDVATGIAAIDCGADAVYIGAKKYGARAQAGNSLSAIARLVAYAHQFRAKVYVTLNTLVYDDEIEEVRTLIAQLHDIGVDAFLVQDMALLRLTEGVATPLHASTQTDNRSGDMVGWLQERGFRRVVLARELSLQEIQTIHAAHPEVELEVFVHGALCVSYSGACYVSQHLFGRSANRGACCHVCRMKFDLVDSAGTVVEHASHLLSLKDLSLYDHLESLADAGVCSFKIEGRLKDIAYVRNVVSAYSQALERLCQRRDKEYMRAAIGVVDYAFTPDLSKTFNRGYTDYFFMGRHPNIHTPLTPKATGTVVGVVKEVRRNHVVVAGLTVFANGDGLCFVNDDGELEGFRVNRAEGNRLFPHVLPTTLRKGMTLYRNNDAAFERLLSTSVATRRIPLSLTLATTADGFSLRATAPSLAPQEVAVVFPHERAKRSQRENITTQLSRWGGTVYKVSSLTITAAAEELFLPSSLLGRLRQTLCHRLAAQEEAPLSAPAPRPTTVSTSPVNPTRPLQHKNVANAIAEELYAGWGATYQRAIEVCPNSNTLPLMQCKHCLRYALGYCERYGGQRPPWREPLFLRLGDGRQLRLSFDCGVCQMNVWTAEPTRKQV